MTTATPAQPIRLVVSDVDGTIIDSDKNVLPGTVAAAQRLAAAGIPLAIVSSRPPRGMMAIKQALGISGPIAGFNGGCMLDGDKVLAEHFIPEDAARKTIAFFEQRNVDIWLFTRDEWLVKNFDGDYVAHERHTVGFDPVVTHDFSPYLAGCGKIVGVSKNIEFLAQCETDLGEQLGATASAHRSQQYYLDINHMDANKGVALKAFAKWYGVDLGQVAALGDMTNDIPMLREAGFGIAMGNAPASVAAIAKAQTGPNTGSGWADAIDRYVLPAKGDAA